MTMHRRYLILLAVAVAALLSYATAIPNQFVWDDVPLVVQNPVIRSLGNLFSAERVPAGEPVPDYMRLQPVTTFSLALDHYFWGFLPYGYHLTNVLLHAGAALLVYWLVLLLTGRRVAALAAGVLFAVHPVHTESVAWISGRPEVLAGVFGLLCVILRIMARTAGGFRRTVMLACSVVAMVLAVFSSETGFVVPILLLAWTVSFRENGSREDRPLWRWQVPYLVAAAGCLLLRLTVLHHAGPQGEATSFGLITALAATVVSGVRYLVLLLWPFRLTIHHPAVSPGLPAAILSLAVVVVLVAGWRYSLRKGGLVPFAVAWSAVSILPALVVEPAGTMAERCLYLSSVGICLLAGVAFDALYSGVCRTRGEDAKRVVMSVGTALCLLLAIRTSVRNLDYRNDLSLWTKTVKQHPEDVTVNEELALHLFRTGRVESAIERYQTIIELAPDNVRARVNLGSIYNGFGRNDIARRLLEEAVEIDPADELAHNNLGLVYRHLGMVQQSLAEHQKAIELNPELKEAHINLGSLLVSQGKNDEARAAWQQSLAIDPNYVPAIENLRRLDTWEAARRLAERPEDLGELTVAELEAVLGADEPKLRATAAWELGRRKSAPSVEKLVAMLDDISPDVRANAAWALGEIGDTSAIRSLVNLLEDNIVSVRIFAAASLGELGNASGVQILIEGLGNENPVLSNTSHEGLVALFDRDPGRDPAKWREVVRNAR